ncbi:hypothetical protein RvY_09180 [Ramazzottius varieornatus]|uniref:BHLH domain-containing protein n=1 Tax=Ramazzottius varieornatus TaxID=947166 RepID=A0A1D1V8H0_RAMVA|nr:hypothetical protein RvY_09180 [Ramazzottius varieornatus]
MNSSVSGRSIPALLWYPSVACDQSFSLMKSSEDHMTVLTPFGFQQPYSYFFSSTGLQQELPHGKTGAREGLISERRTKKVPGSKAGNSADIQCVEPYDTPIRRSAPDPFAPECIIPAPVLHGEHLLYYEPVFLRRRNERERMRVKSVNDGYVRLRQRLPSSLSQKRMSKVEILRSAIEYIRQLQLVLQEDTLGVSGKHELQTSCSRPG